MAPVTVGVLVHSDFGAERPDDLRGHLRRWVTTVESAGLDSIHVPTEIGWDRYGPLATLGLLAGWTERVTIGTCVLLAPLYNPLELAEAVGTVGAVAPGRVVLGLGMGWRPAEFAAAGVAMGERVGRLNEHLATLPALLRGEELTYDGRHYQFDRVRVGLAGPHPVPIWVGAHGPKGTLRSARAADGWVAGPFLAVDKLERQVARYREARREAGRPEGRVAVVRECYVAKDRDAAFAEAAPIQAKYAEYAARVGQMPFDHTSPLPELAAGRFAIGDPEDCARALADVVTRTGATDLVLRTQFRGMDPEHSLAVLGLLGTEVRPRLLELLSS